MKTVLKGLTEVLFPPRCPCCTEVGVDDEPCDKCRKLLNDCRIYVATCDKCGNSLKECDCGKYNHLFFGIAGAFWNKDNAKDAVYAVKFRNRPYAADYFGRQAAIAFKRKFPDIRPDLICSVPMSKRAMISRGFNQAELMAKAAADVLDIPYDKRAISKIKDNKAQHGLNAEQRPANVKGVYKAVGNLDGKIILLVDDVKTTGSTLSECAKQLRLAGAKEVWCAVALITSKDTCKSDESEI